MALFRKSSFCDFRSRRSGGESHLQDELSPCNKVEESLLDCGPEKIFSSVALSRGVLKG